MLSLAVIGMGNRARKYLAYLQEHPDAFRVGAVVEPSEVHLEAARRRRSLRLLCAALPSTLPAAESIAGRGDHRDVALGPTGPIPPAHSVTTPDPTGPHWWQGVLKNGLF